MDKASKQHRLIICLVMLLFILTVTAGNTAGAEALDENGEAVSRGGAPRLGSEIVALAKEFIGAPYRWAGRSPNGFDCSGFSYYIFRERGIDIPRAADEQFARGMSVGLQELELGDLVFFTTYEPGPSHVGIYAGNGDFIHASSAADKVIVTSLSQPYYQTRFLGGRRIIR